MNLRDYQLTAIDDLTTAVAGGNRRLLLQAPTGSGKTCIAAQIVRHAVSNGNRVLFLAHRRELVNQAVEKLESFGVSSGTIMSGDGWDKSHFVDVASIATLHSWCVRRKHEALPKADLVIIDECFPAGTLIDGRPIEDLRVGDSVQSFNEDSQVVEEKKIKRLFCNDYNGDWLRIKDSLGREIVCTENHPIWTKERGYIPAKSLLTLSGDSATLLINELPMVQKVCAATKWPSWAQIQILRYQMLWDGITWREKKKREAGASKTSSGFALLYLSREGRVRPKANQGVRKKWTAILLSRLFNGLSVALQFGGNEENEFARSGKNQPADEKEQSVLRSADKKENSQEAQGEDVSFERWEREVHSPTNCNAHGQRIAYGISNPDGQSERAFSKFAALLQGGLGRSICKIGGRDRRDVPSNEILDIPRQAENGNFKLSRVGSVEVYKRGSKHRPSWVPRTDTVYNLEVEANSNYFANGILVHNCHHYNSSKTWQDIVNGYPEAILLGMTATPINRRGAGLGHFFDAMVKCPTIRELTDQKFLVPAKYYAPSVPDLQGLKVQAGDYVEKQLEERMDRPKLVGDVVENWAKICPDRKTMVFASGIKHSIHLVEAFNAIGVKAAHVDGKTPMEDRAGIIRGFSSGDIQVLSNCQVFTEGTDIPVASALVFARPTKSLLLYLQVAGRVLRPFQGKADAVILDHSGVVYEHGPIDQDWDWRLDYGKGDVSSSTRRVMKLKKEITCGQCKMVYFGKLFCPGCGWKPTVKGKPVETYEGYLIALDEIEQEKNKVDEKSWYRQLVHYATSKGYKPGYAAVKFKDKFSRWPPRNWKSLEPLEPGLIVKAWIQHQNIKWAKSRRNPLNQPITPLPQTVVEIYGAEQEFA